ncbi:5705_t:CDS:2, partial [Gigaspora margarita]
WHKYRETDCTDAKWIEYCNMPQIRNNETSSEWMKWIWEHLTYFRKNNLLPNETICFSCNQFVYTGQRKKNIGNYNYIGMERHWKFSCTSNKYCNISYNEYLLKNAIKKTKRAREIGKKIQAYTIIQRKFIEYYYHPNGLCASELAQHYKLLWVVQEEIRQ